jgi:predicted transcriptional regulator
MTPRSPQVCVITADLESLPDVCGAVRKSRGLSYRRAAEQIGVQHAELHRFEHRVTDPRLTTVIKIVRWINTVQS